MNSEDAPKGWRKYIPVYETTPHVTYTLIYINVGVFICGIISGIVWGITPKQWDTTLGLIPAAVDTGQVYRIVTGAFLHGGWLHLAMNMLALYVIGPSLEFWLGWRKYIALYTASLLGGAALICVFAPPNMATIGASGAIFGLLGALWLMCRKLHIPSNDVLWWIAINLGITFLIPAISGVQISWQGHTGGLITGTMFIFLLCRNPESYVE